MAIIAPTITAGDPHEYREQIERVQHFAKHLHIDLMDGVFTSNKSIATENVWWPEAIIVDIHLMFQEPQTQLEALIKLKPRMVIIHAESDCDITEFALKLNESDIKCGIAVFPDTSIESISNYLSTIQQVLIFSGNLGHQGGSKANLGLLKKVAQIQECSPFLEVAWDGGVTKENITTIALNGVDIINVGGYIHGAPDAALAYSSLDALLP